MAFECSCARRPTRDQPVRRGYPGTPRCTGAPSTGTWVATPDRTVYSALRRGAIAQLGERLNGIQKVGGSNPPSSTTFLSTKQALGSLRGPFDSGAVPTFVPTLGRRAPSSEDDIGPFRGATEHRVRRVHVGIRRRAERGVAKDPRYDRELLALLEDGRASPPAPVRLRSRGRGMDRSERRAPAHAGRARAGDRAVWRSIAIWATVRSPCGAARASRRSPHTLPKPYRAQWFARRNI